jgi:hypothetical protein
MNEFSIEKYNAVLSAIVQAETVQEIKAIHDEASGWQAYFQKTKKAGQEIQLKIMECLLRTERKLGEMLQTAQETGVLANQGGDRKSKSRSGILILSDIGISAKLSSRAKCIAVVPRDEFEKGISNALEAKKLPRNLFTAKPVIRRPGTREVLSSTKEPEITREMLSVSAQKKFDVAIRKYQERLARSFASEVNVQGFPIFP